MTPLPRPSHAAVTCISRLVAAAMMLLPRPSHVAVTRLQRCLVAVMTQVPRSADTQR